MQMKMLKKYIQCFFIFIIVICFGMILGGCVFEWKNKTSKTQTDTQEGLLNYEISYNYEDYIGDLETFTYGLIANELNPFYETFSAYVYSPIYGAITGAAIQIFMEVVVENKTLSNVNWSKVAISAAAGALCSFIGPHVGSAVANGVGSAIGAGTKISMEVGVAIAKYVGDAACILSNSVIIGATSAAFTAIDGGSYEDIAKSFGIGVGLGVALGVAFELVGASISKIASTINTKFPNNWAQRAVTNVKSFINGHQVSLGKMDDILIAKSTYQAAYQGFTSARSNLNTYNELLTKAVRCLPGKNNKNFQICDTKGTPITKSELISNGGNGKIVLKDTIDPNIKQLLVDSKGNPITELKIINGEIDFSDIASAKVTIDTPITTNRRANYINFDKELANEYNKNIEIIPKNIKKYFDYYGFNYQNGQLKETTIYRMRVSLGMTWHEAMDCHSAYLVDTSIHSKLSHYGGIAVSKMQAKYIIGTIYFKELYGGK